MFDMQNTVDLDQDLDVDQDVDLEVSGGAAGRMFPSIERWLYDSPDNRKAFEFVVGKEALEKYKALVDALVCEVFPVLRSWCLKFYTKTGPHISKLVSADDIVQMEAIMLQALAYSLIIHQAHVNEVAMPLSWRMFVAQAKATLDLRLRQV